MTLTVLHSRGITAFELPPPAGVEALPPAVQDAIHQLCKAYFCANAILMLERMTSPACRSIWKDWCKSSRGSNRTSAYVPLDGAEHGEALQATAVMVFSLCYAASLRAKAEALFQARIEAMREHGWAPYRNPRSPPL